MKTWAGAQVFRVKAVNRQSRTSTFDARLIPFADASGTGSRFKVWLPLSQATGGNLLVGGQESRSRPGNLSGSINDDSPSAVCTFDGKAAKQDWYAITLDEPVRVRRVIFLHGRTFHDGGWFDGSAGKPQVQVQRSKESAWETVGALADYPDTTATQSKGLKEAQAFTLRLGEPVQVFGVRVIGQPAYGDHPSQAFSSCAGLRAFSD